VAQRGLAGCSPCESDYPAVFRLYGFSEQGLSQPGGFGNIFCNGHLPDGNPRAQVSSILGSSRLRMLRLIGSKGDEGFLTDGFSEYNIPLLCGEKGRRRDRQKTGLKFMGDDHGVSASTREDGKSLPST